MKILVLIMFFVSAAGLSAQPISKNLIKSLLAENNSTEIKYNKIQVDHKIKASLTANNESGLKQIINIITTDLDKPKDIKYNKLNPDMKFDKKK